MRMELFLFTVGILWAQERPGTETWRFDRLDRIGGHTVAVVGAPRVVDGAVVFNGDGDALFFDVHPLAGATEFTLEVVFRPDRGGRPEQRFFHLQENGVPNRLLLETRLLGDHWCLDSYAHSNSGYRTLIDRTKLHPLGEWVHAAAVYDGREFRHYVNRILQGKSEVKLSPQGAGRTSAGVRINQVDWFKGAIRTARFSRRALQPEEFLGATDR
jgi:hypothetical protein